MKSKPSFTKAEADDITKLIKEKLKADAVKQKGIRAKIRSRGFHASDYGFRDGYTVEQFLSVVKITDTSKPLTKTVASPKVPPLLKVGKPAKPRKESDESYVIDLCDGILKQNALRQHRFDFLKGDSGTRLPVDAFYPSLNLVVEFKEKQHTEEVKFFDRKQTVSGVGRGEQRKIYDQRRREELPKHGIRLIELDYSDFEHTRGKKLMRDKGKDLIVVANKLKRFSAKS